MVDVVRGLVVGGVATDFSGAEVFGGADVAFAGALGGDDVDAGRDEGAVEVADDVPRPGVATGAFDEGAVT